MILTALKGYYDRVADEPDSRIPAFGYSEQKISFALVIGANGELFDEPVDLRVTSGKKPQPRPMAVPEPVKRTVAIAPSFLWDKTSYVLGVTETPDERTRREHAAFKALHAQALAGTDDEGLLALLRFMEDWTPETFTRFSNKDDVRDSNIVFRLDGERRFLHERPAARAVWARVLAARCGEAGLCLVTGEAAALARLHPSIKGVWGGQSSGASIVSFNLDAFTSYGKEQCQNAPVSEEAAFAYTTGLNDLLRQGSRNRVQIADATTVFWAESPGKSAEESALGAFLQQPMEAKEPGARIDPNAAARLRDLLVKIAKGRPLDDVPSGLDGDARLFILGLAPNAARISIRFWYTEEFGRLWKTFRDHYDDLRIDPRPRGPLPGVWRLLIETATQRKSENIPKQIAGEVMRSILTGGRYPRALLAAVVMRMRADHDVNGMRAAICKACLARDHRLGFEKENVPVGLDREEKDAAYRLGRLFAVLESAQRAALGNVNATIRDRYYGAASATPASIVPMLLRNTRNHIAGLRKGKAAAWVKNPEKAAGWYDKEIGQILDALGKDLPKTFKIEDQGRFAVGYYHQRYAKKPDAPEDVQVADTDDAAESNED